MLTEARLSVLPFVFTELALFSFLSHLGTILSTVTTLMNVGNDGPAFKDAVKFLKHSGVILDERGKF